MNVIVIVIIVVVVVILCSVIFKRIAGGVHTIYTPSDNNKCASYGFKPNTKYSARELINDVTDMWGNQRINKNELVKKWKHVKNKKLRVMIATLLNEFNKIKDTLWFLASSFNGEEPRINGPAVITAIAEAFVACYIEKDLILKDFNASRNSGIGTFNMVIKCTATEIDKKQNEVGAPFRCLCTPPHSLALPGD